MTQGFPPGQPMPPMAPQAAYPQQAGYGQPNAARSSGDGSGWALVLGLVGLLPLVFWLGLSLVGRIFDFNLFSDYVFLTFWAGSVIQEMLAWAFHSLVPNLMVVAAVMTMFRSAVGRILLVVSSAFAFLAGVLTLIGTLGVPLPAFYAAIPVLILAFLPPVNQAFRKATATGGQPPMGYGAPAMAQQAAYPQSQPQPVQQQPMQYPAQQPMQPQQPQPYPQQQWQQPY